MSDHEDRIRVRVVAHGQVQGVFFRASVKERAEQHGIAGWVRNRADGSVEALFEGRRLEVEELVSWCSQGPERARVARLDVIDEEPQGIRGFRLR